MNTARPCSSRNLARRAIRGAWCLALGAVALLGFASRGATLPVRTQTVELQAGWNAVWLEVQPADAAPEILAKGLPIQSVAVFLRGSQGERFLRQPGDAPWKEEGWAVWHAPGQPEDFLSNLHAIPAHRGLLVRAASACTWKVTGTVDNRPLEWEPNTCTFIGLPVDPAAPPTFAAFFAGSPAHARLRIYRLEAGLWKLVRDPSRDRIRAGEAYWIQTEGGSTYQGLLDTDLGWTGVLDFSASADEIEWKLFNRGTVPAAFRLEVVGGAPALPLVRLITDPRTRTETRTLLGSVVELEAIAAGSSTALRLAPDRAAMAPGVGSVLLRVTDGRGSLRWVPVRAAADLASALAQP